jgi:hypothetical protein
MGDRLNSKSSVVSKIADIVILKNEANSVVGRFNFRHVVMYFCVSDKDFLKKVNWKLPHGAARSFRNSTTNLISLNFSFDLPAVSSIAYHHDICITRLKCKVTVLYGCNMWRANARKGNKPKLRKNIPRRIFKKMKVTEMRGKLHNKCFPTYFQQIFYIHNGPNDLFIYEHM